MCAMSLTALAAGFARLLTIVGEIAGIVLLTLTLTALAGDLTLHLRIHRCEAAPRLGAAVLRLGVLIVTTRIIVGHDPHLSGFARMGASCRNVLLDETEVCNRYATPRSARRPRLSALARALLRRASEPPNRSIAARSERCAF